MYGAGNIICGREGAQEVTDYVQICEDADQKLKQEWFEMWNFQMCAYDLFIIRSETIAHRLH